jgi:RNA polymerase sigma-70 factor (ECF subfamily)
MAFDRELLVRLRRGEPEAFEEVYVAEKATVYGFLLRLSRDASVAADLFQNVWLKLAQNAVHLREDSNLIAWLLTVARREYLSFRRAQALDLSRALLLGLTHDEVAVGAGDDELQSVIAALDRLADADREILLLSVTGRLGAEQVSCALGISAVAQRQRLARARQRLAAAVEDLESVPSRTLARAARS